MQKLAQQAQELLNLHLTTSQQQSFSLYQKELLVWNEKISLTAIRDADSIRAKHFLDSLSCVLAWANEPPKTLVDVGAGAGFPGIPLKIIYPALKLTIVESVEKKANFCQHIVETLHLSDVRIIRARAETVGQNPRHRESYDIAVARAVAQLPVLSEYLLPLVKVGGFMLAQKGESAAREAQEAENAIQILGGRLQKLIPLTLPDVVEARYLVLAEKVSPTPSQYPRREGLPSKRAL